MEVISNLRSTSTRGRVHRCQRRRFGVTSFRWSLGLKHFTTWRLCTETSSVPTYSLLPLGFWNWEILMYPRLIKKVSCILRLGPRITQVLKSGKTNPMMQRAIFGASVVSCMSCALLFLHSRHSIWKVSSRRWQGGSTLPCHQYILETLRQWLKCCSKWIQPTGHHAPGSWWCQTPRITFLKL